MTRRIKVKNPTKAPAKASVQTPVESSDSARGVLATIRAIQSGAIEASSLSESDRQRCVEHLTADGLLTAEVADILKVSERTIARDRKAIRCANAIERDPQQVGQFVGQMVREADLAVVRIRRASRDKTVPPAVKVDAEHRCWQIVRDLITRLQSLGYLPTAAQHIQAELSHSMSEPEDLDALQQQIQELMEICNRQEDADPQMAEELSRAQQQLLQLKLAGHVELLATTLRKDPQNDL